MKLEAKLKDEEFIKAKKKVSTTQIYEEIELETTTITELNNG